MFRKTFKSFLIWSLGILKQRSAVSKTPLSTETFSPKAQESPRNFKKRNLRSNRKNNGASSSNSRTNSMQLSEESRSYFGDIPLPKAILRAVTDMGYSEPTKIQELVIKPFMEKADIVGQAQTGTGKTASFGIPALSMVDRKNRKVQVLVLVPTRELARQVSAELTKISKYSQVSVLSVYGGTAIGPQINSLSRGTHVVVGTPGRIIDHIMRGSLVLTSTKIVVLDEADQMLDIGFLPDIRRILRRIPSSRQTCLFTATVPTQIKRLVYSYLNDPQWLIVGRDAMPVDEVNQQYYEVAERDKPEAMSEVLASHQGEQMLLFCRTQIAVDRVVKILRSKGHRIVGIHGAMHQKERDKVMSQFRSGEVKLLVSTNLTSRGIDIPTVENVINYDIPDSIEDYLHRIGRTARMGRPGNAITFVGEWDLELFDKINDHVGPEHFKKGKLSLYGG